MLPCFLSAQSSLSYSLRPGDVCASQSPFPLWLVVVTAGRLASGPSLSNY
jgi:hypothetical protein